MSVLHHSNIYADPEFVYPPTAAPMFVPMALVDSTTGLRVWILLLCLALALSVTVISWAAGSTWWPTISGFVTAIVFKSDPATDSLFFSNLSLMLVPVAVLSLLSAEKGNWRPFSWLVAASLLVKPLLAPLLLISFIWGRYKDTCRVLAGAGVVLLLALAAVPGGWAFLRVVHYLSGGSSLTGGFSVANLSMSGLAESTGQAWVPWVGTPIVIAVAGATVWRLASRRAVGDLAAASGVLLQAVFLAGTLSELHFLFVPYSCLALATALRGRWSDVGAICVAATVFLYPRYYLPGLAESGTSLQLRWIVAEVLLLAVGLVMAVSPPRPNLDPNLSVRMLPPPLDLGHSDTSSALPKVSR